MPPFEPCTLKAGEDGDPKTYFSKVTGFGYNDMISLPTLTKDSILDNLKRRFKVCEQPARRWRRHEPLALPSRRSPGLRAGSGLHQRALNFLSVAVMKQPVGRGDCVRVCAYVWLRACVPHASSSAVGDGVHVRRRHRDLRQPLQKHRLCRQGHTSQVQGRAALTPAAAHLCARRSDLQHDGTRRDVAVDPDLGREWRRQDGGDEDLPHLHLPGVPTAPRAPLPDPAAVARRPQIPQLCMLCADHRLPVAAAWPALLPRQASQTKGNRVADEVAPRLMMVRCRAPPSRADAPILALAPHNQRAPDWRCRAWRAIDTPYGCASRPRRPRRSVALVGRVGRPRQRPPPSALRPPPCAPPPPSAPPPLTRAPIERTRCALSAADESGDGGARQRQDDP